MKTISWLAAALALAACATPTPYQPKDRAGYGFSEQRLEANRFRIEFKGNSLTTRAQVENALLYRAADLTLANGFDYFVATARETDSRTNLMYQGPSYPNSAFYFTGRYYGPRLGWRPWYDTFWDSPANYYAVTRFEANAEVAMFKGRKPADNALAFDAREVQANLEEKIALPAPAPGP